MQSFSEIGIPLSKEQDRPLLFPYQEDSHEIELAVLIKEFCESFSACEVIIEHLIASAERGQNFQSYETTGKREPYKDGSLDWIESLSTSDKERFATEVEELLASSANLLRACLYETPSFTEMGYDSERQELLRCLHRERRRFRSSFDNALRKYRQKAMTRKDLRHGSCTVDLADYEEICRLSRMLSRDTIKSRGLESDELSLGSCLWEMAGFLKLCLDDAIASFTGEGFWCDIESSVNQSFESIDASFTRLFALLEQHGQPSELVGLSGLEVAEQASLARLDLAEITASFLQDLIDQNSSTHVDACTELIALDQVQIATYKNNLSLFLTECGCILREVGCALIDGINALRESLDSFLRKMSTFYLPGILCGSMRPVEMMIGDTVREVASMSLLAVKKAGGDEKWSSWIAKAFICGLTYLFFGRSFACTMFEALCQLDILF